MAFTPTAIGGTGASRFGQKKNLELLLVPQPITDLTTLVPTEAEINTGTNITCAINATTGFNATDSYAELPDLCSDFAGKVWNGASLADSSITFYNDKTATGDAYDLLTTGDEWVLYQCPWGLAGAKKALAWAIEIGSVLPPIATEGASLTVVNMSVVALSKITLPAET